MATLAVAQYAANFLPFPVYIVRHIIEYLPFSILYRLGGLSSATWSILTSEPCEFSSLQRLLEITDGHHPLWTPRLFDFGNKLVPENWPKTWTSTLAYLLSQQSAFVDDDLPTGRCSFNGECTLQRRFPPAVCRQSLALGVLTACYAVDRPWNPQQNTFLKRVANQCSPTPDQSNTEEDISLVSSLTSRLLPFLHRSEHEIAARTAWTIRWALDDPDKVSKLLSDRSIKPLQRLREWSKRSQTEQIPKPAQGLDLEETPSPASFWCLTRCPFERDTTATFTSEEFSAFYLSRREQRIKCLLQEIQSFLGRVYNVCDDDVISAVPDIRTTSRQRRNVVTIFGENGLCFIEVLRRRP